MAMQGCSRKPELIAKTFLGNTPASHSVFSERLFAVDDLPGSWQRLSNCTARNSLMLLKPDAAAAAAAATVTATLPLTAVVSR